MVRESDPIRGSSEDPTPEETTDTNRTAKYINQLRNRLRRLEENRATRSDLGGGFADPEAILSPISRVVDRGTSADVVSITTQPGASSSVIDDFEDDDVAEYSDPNNAMQTLSYPADEGNHALRIDSTSDGTRQNGISSSGLPYYPSDGDTFRYRAYVMNDSRAIMLFGSDGSADNTYEIALDSSTDEAIATLVDGGSSSTLFSIDVGTLPTAVWIEVEVAWTAGGGFTVEVFDENASSLGSDSTTDSTYVSGGVGWGVAASGVLGQQKSAYFDYARTTTSSSVIDDAEDADISEYSGDTGSASVKNSAQIPVYHGAYAIELDGQATIYAPQGNLNNDAVAGDSFSSHHYPVTGSVVRFLFGVQDGSNYYFVEADEPSGTLSVSVVSGGSASSLGSSSVTVPTDEWVEIAIDWGSAGSIDAELFAADGTSQGTVSVSDSTYTNGGHGWAEQGSVTSYHDYALVTVGGAQTSPVTDGLAAWYKMNSGSGDLTDSGPNGLTGTNNAIWQDTGAKTGGWCIDFDPGRQHHVNLGPSDLFTPDTITVCAWVQAHKWYDTSERGPSPASTFVAKDDDANGRSFVLSAVDESGNDVGDNPEFILIGGVGGVASTTPLPTGTWFHIAGTYDGSTMELYIDGSLESSTSASGNVADTSGDAWIGARTYSGSEDYYNGSIDDVRVYNRALSQSEIQTIISNTS